MWDEEHVARPTVMASFAAHIQAFERLPVGAVGFLFKLRHGKWPSCIALAGQTASRHNSRCQLHVYVSAHSRHALNT